MRIKHDASFKLALILLTEAKGIQFLSFLFKILLNFISFLDFKQEISTRTFKNNFVILRQSHPIAQDGLDWKSWLLPQQLQALATILKIARIIFQFSKTLTFRKNLLVHYTLMPETYLKRMDYFTQMRFTHAFSVTGEVIQSK